MRHPIKVLRKSNLLVSSLIDAIIAHLNQFKYIEDDNDDSGNYYDNFVDGRGF